MNQLQYEKSPYLLQHKNNPVQWHAWNAAAFERAKQENKPIFLSIGYSTCHWCHVMARESFEDPTVAGLLNENFVAIKVDREERPDVDAIYMSALLSLTGSGGWPLSAWLTPDARPFFAGTYFPPAQFTGLCNRIGQLWKQERERLTEDAEKFVKALKINLLNSEAKGEPSVESTLLARYDSDFEMRFDEDFGGFKGGPKFPQNMSLMALMRNDLVNGMSRSRDFVNSSLEGMISAGLFDHLDGGFHRYCVDAEWNVSHFEKMLYDQAWNTMALFEASQFLDDKRFSVAAEQTLQFVSEQLTHADGGFYAALDAESVNPATGKKVEGFYYTFTPSEIDSAEEFLKVCPQVEGRIVLHRPPEQIKIDWQRLLQIRNQHPRPSRDEKIITAWNGWMIGAYCKGYDVTGGDRWLKTAEKAWVFAKENLIGKRRWALGDTSIPSTSEDDASMIFAALRLHHSTLKPEYLQAAIQLQGEMNKKFWSDETSGFFLSGTADKNLLFRFQQDGDLVSPSSNSLAADNLIRLALITGRADFAEQADRLMANLNARFERVPLNWGYFVVSAGIKLMGKKIVVENPGAETKKLREWLRKSYQPFLQLTVIEKPTSSAESFQFCTQEHCLAPVSSFGDLTKYFTTEPKTP